MSRENLPLEQAIEEFLAGHPERRQLVQFFTSRMLDNPHVKRFVVQVLQEAEAQVKTPGDVFGLGLMYGCALGVMAERRGRKKVIVV